MPDPLFSENALDSSKWTAKQKREYGQLVGDAYADGYASGKDMECQNSHGKLGGADCKCRGCSGARAAADKQRELTGVDTSKPAAS